MDSTALRSAYNKLLDAASIPDLGDADDGGWNAEQILAHVLSITAGTAAVALGVVSGSRPTHDSRISQDPWNLGRIIAEHADRGGIDRARPRPGRRPL